MAAEPLTEGEIERLRGLCKADLSDPMQAQTWALQVQADLERLIERAEEAERQEGEAFARNLRAALETRILRSVNGAAQLTSDVETLSLSTHILPGAVIVDCRLRVGRWTSR